MEMLHSDFDSLSDSSSCEDQDEITSLYSGHACSILLGLEETIGKIDEFLSFERGFMTGDIVRMAADPLGQMGRVIGTNMIVDLENTHGYRIQNVNSQSLQKIRPVSVGDYVVSRAWLGKVKKVIDHVMVQFDNGELSTVGSEKLICISPDLLEDSQYPFYPGQRVQVESSSVSKSTRWLCGKRKDEPDQGTVCKVDAGLLYVEWLSCAFRGSKEVTSPPCFQDLKDLALLSSFSRTHWQLGDWCVLPAEQISPNVSASKLVVWTKNLGKSLQTRNLSPHSLELAVIVKTKTTVDVQWQDGSQSLELESNSLFPVTIVDIHDFWPDEFVLEKGTYDDSYVSGLQRWGVVRCVDSKEKTVKVKWISSDANRLLELDGEQTEEVVSAYELVEHPDYSYSIGDAVFRLHKGELDDQVNESFKNYPISKFSTGKEVDFLETTDQFGGENEHMNRDYFSHIGIIVGIKGGDVMVKWASGVSSKVAPYEICGVDNCAGMTATSLLRDENVQQSNEKIPMQENLSSDQKQKDMLDFNHNNVKDSGSYSFSRVAIGVFTSVASSMFGSLGASLVSAYRSISNDEERPQTCGEEEPLEFCDTQKDSQFSVAGDLETSRRIALGQRAKGANEVVKMSCGSRYPECFRQFDMVSGCSDHQFVNGSGVGLQSTQVKRSWLKRVHDEWSILDKDLPETIFVRVYEERMDLLRAVIVGMHGTPYHDGLFFFDICFPVQYPSVPPMVYYNSGGLRINPNLYESGKVCLSLLNTWTGSSTEVWNPGTSTVLQILLSLQALVLNEKPYFNEAGYDTQIGKAEGEMNSVSYNENAFLVNCLSMLYLLRKPPKHFEALVDEHFKRCGRDILLACKAYNEGAPIGNPFGNCSSELENEKGSSMGFKIMLGKLFPKLVEAFSEKGIECSQL